MNPLLNQILAISTPRHIEYLVLDENFKIVEMSLGVQHFAEFPDEVRLGKDVRLSFPELVGSENYLISLIQGQQSSFELKGISRSLYNQSPLYIDFSVQGNQDEQNFKNRIVMLLEDVTEKMVLQQNLLQKANESDLLLSALAASHNYIDKIITSMAEALIVTTKSGQIKITNQAAQIMFGYNEDELINQPISKIIGDKNFLRIIEIFSLSASQQHPSLPQGKLLEDVEVICQLKTGEEIVVAFSCSVIYIEIENMQDFVYIGRNITERKQAETEIRKALAKEKELGEFKSRFVSIVSHEIRNPLNTVLMSVEILKEYGHEIAEEEKNQYLDYIQTASKQMAQLLKDVLTLNKVEAGKFHFNPAPLDLVNFCSNLVKELEIGTANQQRINFILAGTIESEVYMDEQLLRHILSNLLSNAIKYSPQGDSVYFELLFQRDEVIFQIKDNGIGISPEDQYQLFESFYRGKNVGRIPGTGLGLAIAKQSVELHGGTISVISEVGAGTTFTVKIPFSQLPQIQNK